MSSQIVYEPLVKEKLKDAIEVVVRANLDTREEIEHHLSHIESQYVAIDNDKVIGVIGWYQDNANYASEAMGTLFPGQNAYWVSFFAVDSEYQGRGIGSLLLQKLEDMIKAKGEKELWVSSVPETKSYYKIHGYNEVKEGEISGNHKFFMVKELV